MKEKISDQFKKIKNSDKLKKIFLDFIPAFLGVLVALWLGDLREDYKENKFIDKALENLYIHNRDNIDSTIESIKSLELNLDTLQCYMNDSSLNIIDIISKNNGVQIGIINTTTINILTNSKIIMGIDYGVVLKISELKDAIIFITENDFKSLSQFVTSQGASYSKDSKEKFARILSEYQRHLLNLKSDIIYLNNYMKENEIIDIDINDKRLNLLIGTYTNESSEGIYSCDLQLYNGNLGTSNLLVKTPNPSYLEISKDKKTVIAANELAGDNAGAISLFKFNEDKLLDSITQESSLGVAPCYVTFDKNEQNIMLSNYGGGNTVSYKIKDGKNLEINANIDHKKVLNCDSLKSNAHSIAVSPDGKYAFACDLGLDKVLMFKISDGNLEFNSKKYIELEKGAGPRHFVFHPKGKYAYCINERNNTITHFEFNRSTGLLKLLKSYPTLPSDFVGTSYCADIHFSQDGKYLYGSNRGHNSIVVFECNYKGELKSIQHQNVQGDWPRNFVIDPTNKYLIVANQKSNNIVSFHINSKTGKLSPTGYELKMSMPVCLKFLH